MSILPCCSLEQSGGAEACRTFTAKGVHEEGGVCGHTSEWWEITHGVGFYAFSPLSREDGILFSYMQGSAG